MMPAGEVKMATYSVLVQPDPFARVMSRVEDYVPTPHPSEADRVLQPKFAANNGTDLEQLRYVPRPIQGMHVKPNTPAFAQVVSTRKGQEGVISVLNGIGGPDGTDPSGRTDRQTAWTSWLLQTVREERVEKTQLVETFGESYLFAFGERPRTLLFQGVLLNSEDYNWRSIFWENWENHFRATRLVEQQARMYISFDDVLVEGYPLNAVTNQIADNPNMMMFTFTFFVTNYTSLARTTAFSNSAQRRADLVAARAPEQLPGEINTVRKNQQVLNLLGRPAIRKAAGELGLAAAKVSPPFVAGLTELVIEQTGNLSLNTLANANSDQLLNMVNTDMARFAQAFTAYILKSAIPATGLSETEFNAWYGYASQLVRDAAVRLGIGPSLADLDSPAFNAVFAGSVDRMIAQMGYAIEAGLRRPHTIVGPA